MPESLQKTFGKLRQPAQVFAPRRELSLADGRLGDVIEHERLLRELRDQLHRHRQMSWEQQQVVGQTELAKLPDAATEFRQQHETVIRLVVDDVPDADQPRMLGVLRQLLAEFRRAQVHPAHHAPDEVVFVGQFQQPLRLLDHLPRLHGDGAVEPAGFEQRAGVRPADNRAAARPSRPSSRPGAPGCIARNAGGNRYAFFVKVVEVIATGVLAQPRRKRGCSPC